MSGRAWFFGILFSIILYACVALITLAVLIAVKGL